MPYKKQSPKINLSTKKERLISYAQAINEALTLMMKSDPSVLVVGEGVPDPKGIFGTTIGLREQFGSERVLDTPVSENGLTGICIGAAVAGMRPVLIHQRVDFSLLAFDQIVNNAAKWYFMFGGVQSIPLLIRVIIGRGWGQGSQHSQNLQALFAHIPGLKVIMPTTAYDAKGMIVSAIFDNNPVICLEHRWLYHLTSHVPEGLYKQPLGKAKVVHKGKDLTIVATSYAVIESLEVTKKLKKIGVSVEVIDLRSLSPLDEKTITTSVLKTGRLLVVDTAWVSYGITGEIIARVVEKLFGKLKAPPRRIGLPDTPTPAGPILAKDYYPNQKNIACMILSMLGKNTRQAEGLFGELNQLPPDVPHETFTGPF